jgi:hypothetical protein
MSFSNLKKQSGNFEKLTKALENLSNTENSQKTDKFWKPEVDKSGNGYAVIRFLPSPFVDSETEGEALPWVKIYDHGFQGVNGWYIENSLTTLGHKDPVSEYNSQLWTSGIEANKEIARKQKRRLSYISNIYVVEDPKNPQNEGKVFLFKYGKKIFEKIKEAMNPQFADEKPVNPFDLWAGADFKLKIRNVEGYRNYDKSEFATPGVLEGLSDDALEKVWKSEHSLKEFLAPENFKSYAELEAKLNRVLGVDGAAPKMRTTAVEQASAPVAKPKAKPAAAPVADTSDDDDDTDLSYFSKLVEQD